MIPELVAKWIAGNGISPSMLCLVQEEEDADSSKVDQGQEVFDEKKPESQNPIVCEYIPILPSNKRQSLIAVL